MRPVIGVTAAVEPASWRVWRDVPAVVVAHAFVRQVHDAGGIAVVVPPLGSSAAAEDAAAVLSRLDGLILSGGVDVEPSRYGQEPHPLLQEPRPDRDESELLLANTSAESDLPVLGVCRGMQVMAVAAGGRLEQHLPDRLGHTRHSPAPATYGEHAVRIQTDTQLHRILGNDATVRTYHHQGVVSHPGFLPTSWSVDDDVLESFEDPAARFRLAVQWHPEAGSDLRLVSALVEAASGESGQAR